MRTALLLVLLLLVLPGCGGRSPTADVEEQFPGAEEYLTWNKYLLIRYPPDPDFGTVKAILLQRSGGSWNKLGESREGFVRLAEVQTYIPEMDESGVAAFDLR